MRGPLNLPNILTVSRLILLPGLFVAFPVNNNMLILVLMGLIFASDVLDGWLARRWGLASTLGKILDHAVDKFVIVGIILLLVMFRGMPWWVLALFLLREAITSVVGIILLRKKIEISGSNLLGKLTGFFFGVLSVAYVVAFPWRGIFLWITVGLAALASGSYVYYHFAGKGHTQKARG
ncbi:MAG: CDP-alcohol phosphatidyltransferase family protein [candidate division WOR-3 bacterium]